VTPKGLRSSWPNWRPSTWLTHQNSKRDCATIAKQRANIDNQQPRTASTSRPQCTSSLRCLSVWPCFVAKSRLYVLGRQKGVDASRVRGRPGRARLCSGVGQMPYFSTATAKSSIQQVGVNEFKCGRLLHHPVGRHWGKRVMVARGEGVTSCPEITGRHRAESSSRSVS